MYIKRILTLGKVCIVHIFIHVATVCTVYVQCTLYVHKCTKCIYNYSNSVTDSYTTVASYVCFYKENILMWK
jgi:hypothetical protein